MKKSILDLGLLVLAVVFMSGIEVESNLNDSMIYNPDATTKIEITSSDYAPPTPCYCNIGGYCESSGSLDQCGFVASGGGGWNCSAGTPMCDDIDP